jgi:hypothetical protein
MEIGFAISARQPTSAGQIQKHEVCPRPFSAPPQSDKSGGAREREMHLLVEKPKSTHMRTSIITIIHSFLAKMYY